MKQYKRVERANNLIDTLIIGIACAALYIGLLALADLNDGRVNTVVNQLVNNSSLASESK